MEIRIRDEFIKLGQALKLAELVSDGVEAKYVINDGLVKVNGEEDTRRGRKVYGGDVISYNGQDVKVLIYVNRKNQIRVSFFLISDKARCFRVYQVNVDGLIINNLQCIDQELGIKSDQNIFSLFLNINILVHGTHCRINLQLHAAICNVDNDRFLISFSYKKCSTGCK